MRGWKILFIVLLLGGCNTLTEETPIESCQNNGGEWNECSSGCLGTDAELCAQVCVSQCECLSENDFSCPEGYECRHLETDLKGACIKI